MIPLQRERTVKAVSTKFRGPKKSAKDKELLLAQRDFLRGLSAEVPFQSTFWKTAKTQLKKESGGKCAYCEANTEIVAHGDVEHYRPKSVYWWLAYTYDNYLYACQICNQVYKSDNFPIAGTALLQGPTISATTTDAEIDQLVGQISPDPLAVDTEYTLASYVAEHRKEMAFLLNPYFDDPSEYLAYEADDATKEVRVIPTKPEYAGHVKAAEDYYGLNRIELRNYRYKTYKTYQLFKRSLSRLTDERLKADVLEQLKEMRADDYLFAGMNRYFDVQSS
ncbi:hypothetical protein DNI29_22370 [Hymenobacter sediminis]|uniref:hypothetical protein n=1 Tax=Hymenobacter sediminis TaxID=2218621 RepID=UPI000DA69E1C|nr:hypothetical protein [Hymenobacter sediminis]RPD44144.1 hypothetical protein DNI29_22370 [Hymenobacter sediminis]